MTARHARAPRGERARGRAPAKRGTNRTLIAAVSLAGLGAAMTLAGAADGAACVAYVREVLVPTLTPGQIVVWDTVRTHHGAELRAMIEAHGCQLVFLPPYSPDFNPMEEAFSKLKTFLRRAGARTTAALDAAIGAGLATITATDAAGWFAHAGYTPLPQPV